MFYYVASNRMQSYTASTVIEYANTARARDLRRTAARIDTSEIYGSYIIAKVIQNLGIDPSTANMDDIRNSITITSIITDEQQQIFDAKVTQGEDASLIATRYMVTFNSGVASGKDYPARDAQRNSGRVFGLLRQKRTSIPRAARTGVNDILRQWLRLH